MKRELDNTRATITHLIMSQLMKSFEGKSKAVQFKIAEDFNKMDVNSPEVNLYDMVQGYCADLATVGDSKPHVVGVVTCTVCQSDAHESAECPARKQLARELNEANRAKKLSGGVPGARTNRKPSSLPNPSHAHLTCHSCQKLGHISPNCPDKALLAAQAQVLAAQSLSTTQAPLGIANAIGAGQAMSNEQACLIAQNILSGMDSSYAPASSPPAYGTSPALSVTNTSPLSPQVLAALVSQLRSGSTSLLVRTVEGESKKQDMEKEESVADMVTRAVEAWCAEEIEVKPVEVPAEMAEVDEIPDLPTDLVANDSSCTQSDTSNLSDDEMEDIVMKLRQQSKDQETGSKSEESDYDESRC